MLAAQAGKLGGPEPGLHGQQEQRVVTSPDRRGAVGHGQERVDLGLGEVADERRLVALVGDREHARDLLCALRRFQRREVEERVDRGQPRVAGPDAV